MVQQFDNAGGSRTECAVTLKSKRAEFSTDGLRMRGMLGDLASISVTSRTEFRRRSVRRGRGVGHSDVNQEVFLRQDNFKVRSHLGMRQRTGLDVNHATNTTEKGGQSAHDQVMASRNNAVTESEATVEVGRI